MNNYNTNANGPDIELDVSFDTDIAQWYFEENFKSDGDDLIYMDYGNVPDNWEKEIAVDWDAVSDDTIFQIIEEVFVSKDFNGVEDARLFLDDEASGLSFDDLLALCNDYEVDYTLNYFTVVSRGYSQGDYAEIIMPNVLADIWGRDLNDIENEDTEYLDNLLWDEPIYARAIIDGKEIYLDESLEDRYKWDKEAVIKWINENVETGAAELIEMLPHQPYYK